MVSHGDDEKNRHWVSLRGEGTFVEFEEHRLPVTKGSFRVAVQWKQVKKQIRGRRIRGAVTWASGLYDGLQQLKGGKKIRRLREA